MNTVRSTRSNIGDGLKSLVRGIAHGRGLNRGAAWGLMIVGAVLAFEVFNYSTTQFALHDVLGDLTFAGFRWATILAIAFCGIDFAGIARIFTPQQGRDEPAEVWYLFGAWLLAAGFNATLTWWGVSVAIVNHTSAAADAVVSNHTLIKIVPIFVAVMVWLIRVLIIGTFSTAGDNLFSTGNTPHQNSRSFQQTSRPMSQGSSLRTASPLPHPASQPYRSTEDATLSRASMPLSSTVHDYAEPTYHNVSFGASASNDGAGEHRLS